MTEIQKFPPEQIKSVTAIGVAFYNRNTDKLYMWHTEENGQWVARFFGRAVPQELKTGEKVNEDMHGIIARAISDQLDDGANDATFTAKDIQSFRPVVIDRDDEWDFGGENVQSMQVHGVLNISSEQHEDMVDYLVEVGLNSEGELATNMASPSLVRNVGTASILKEVLECLSEVKNGSLVLPKEHKNRMGGPRNEPVAVATLETGLGDITEG
jgi:hypothetical protein